MLDLLIVGAGPAGVSSAIYAQRAGLDFVIMDKIGIGGVLSLVPHIENYPGIKEITGFQLAQEFKAHLEYLGIKFLIEEVKSISKEDNDFCINTSGNKYVSKSVILATGSQPRKLNIKGEEEFRGKGVSYCAVCDGFFFRGKRVCIIGGGNTALEDALYLSKIAEEVFIVHRRSEFRGFPALLRQIEEVSNIKKMLCFVPVEIRGEEKVKQIILKSTSSDRFETLNVDGVFISIGRISCIPQFNNLNIALDKDNFIITDENMRSSVKGIFACGDVRSKNIRQIITACAEGTIALFSVIEYLKTGS